MDGGQSFKAVGVEQNVNAICKSKGQDNGTTNQQVSLQEVRFEMGTGKPQGLGPSASRETVPG
ncbi:hypothetical protein LCGC14_2234200 [marine sediment metagenome]|uniref:Uncharacterized protein n=1 Tax=marine sediment metagenome TaxID=412755 RepID=A0A0F9FJV6_9ZZZZ